VHKCEVPALDCNNGSYQGHSFTSMLAVPTGTSCPAGMLTAWTLGAQNGTCCASWGPGSCFDGDNSPCAAGQLCTDGVCKGDYGMACLNRSQCASKDCSQTVRKCEVPALDCNNGSYQGNPFTSMLSVPTGTSCPADLLSVWELGAGNGTCCASWGPGACFENSQCLAGKVCSQAGFCLADYGASCTNGSQCASGDCSPTVHKCEVPALDCNNGSFQGHAFTSMLSVPTGAACPAGLLTAWTLGAQNGTCCASWGPGSCFDNSVCTAGTTCVNGLCM
jgi:hypothetical protein